MATTYARKTIVVIDAVCYRCKGTGAFAGKAKACYACHGAGHMRQNRPIEEVQGTVQAPVQAATIAGKAVRELQAAIDEAMWANLEEPIEVTDEPLDEQPSEDGLECDGLE